MTEHNALLDDIFIIIVLYKQSLSHSTSFQSLTKAVGQSVKPTLFVYDNSPEVGAIPELNSWRIIYQHNSSNPGVSQAYNEGFKIAKQEKKKWLLFMDQDTEFPTTIFSDYFNAVQKYPHIDVFAPSLFDSIGLVSPFQLQLGKGRRIKALTMAIYSLEKFKIINSGMLVSLDAFEKAGGYDERFPLDYSDISFCDRVAKNDPAFVLMQSRCYHHFSATRRATDLPTETARFKSFCKATLLYKKTSTSSVIPIWIIISRSSTLSFQMKSFRFLKIGIEHILHTR